MHGVSVTAVEQKQLPLRPAGPDTVAALLAWYDAERRDLPWRKLPRGRKTPDPYRVWLSEIMLQQTTVKAVIPYYQAFLKRWPKVKALAAAELDEVLAAWAGLGYYSRARNLKKCAEEIVNQHGGKFPKTSSELIKLPGIGPYTAAAIAAIAFDEPATPVDGNIERVIARLFAVKTKLPKAKPEIAKLAATLTPEERPGDYAQAMMDLGATVCTPRRPSCLMCPLQQDCHGFALGLAPELPRRAPKEARPIRLGVAFLAQREDGLVLLRRREEAGLLGGMMEVPSTPWQDKWLETDEVLRTAPIKAKWVPIPGIVSHTFTHFKLELMVYRAVVPPEEVPLLWAEPERCRWVHRRDLDDQALPSVMRKVIAHGMEPA